MRPCANLPLYSYGQGQSTAAKDLLVQACNGDARRAGHAHRDTAARCRSMWGHQQTSVVCVGSSSLEPVDVCKSGFTRRGSTAVFVNPDRTPGRVCEMRLASKDETVNRFDTLALVREFRITVALPALRVLAGWLEPQHSPGAPYEWAKVNRLIGVLTEPFGNQWHPDCLDQPGCLRAAAAIPGTYPRPRAQRGAV